MTNRIRSLGIVSFVLVSLGIVSGCATDGTTPKASVPRPEVMPSYMEAADRFNARVDRLDRVWASAVITIRTPKESGGTRLDQAEGYLQIEQPTNTSLSIMKLGETYFYMGSDEQAYWWLDLSEDTHVALYGLHREATPEVVTELGLPVHPIELLELFAVTPLDYTSTEAIGDVALAAGRVDWDATRGELRVTTSSRWGTRVMWLDPQLFSPQRTELRDARGRVRAACEMGRYASVPVRGDGRVPPKMASQYRVEFPQTEARATLQLYGLTNKPISPRAFDFRALCEAYGVDQVLLLRPGGVVEGVLPKRDGQAEEQ